MQSFSNAAGWWIAGFNPSCSGKSARSPLRIPRQRTRRPLLLVTAKVAGAGLLAGQHRPTMLPHCMDQICDLTIHEFLLLRKPKQPHGWPISHSL